MIRDWNLFFAHTPLVLTVVCTEPPYAHGFDLESAERTMRLWREASTLMAMPVLGLPAIAVPTGLADGLPVGVQLVGPRFREDLVLAAAEAIEARVPKLAPDRSALISGSIFKGGLAMLARHRLALAAALAAAVSGVRPLAQTTLRVVMHSDLKIVDPIWTTAYITRNHGYMIYDTLFATDANGEVKPQMIDKYDLSADKLTWTFTLRDGLLFHDGAPVTAEDASRRSSAGAPRTRSARR